MISIHDVDIEDKSVHELKAEVRRLRMAIRHHRDLKGNDRCWMDDLELYAHLPEREEGDLRLPPKEEFLKNCAAFCEKFWRLRCPHQEYPFGNEGR